MRYRTRHFIMCIHFFALSTALLPARAHAGFGFDGFSYVIQNIGFGVSNALKDLGPENFVNNAAATENLTSSGPNSLSQAAEDKIDFEKLDELFQASAMYFEQLLTKPNGFRTGTALGDFLEKSGLASEERNAALLAFGRAIANADPFIGADFTFTNQTDDLIDIQLLFEQEVIPIGRDVPLQFDTFLTAEVTDSSGDGQASVASVLADHARGLSDINNPAINTLVNAPGATDFLSNLTAGAPAETGAGPADFFLSNLDVEFLVNAGVQEADIATVTMSTNVIISDLSPGDTINLRFAYSIGAEDHTIPFFPAEALVIGLEAGVFFPIPEPSSLSLITLVVSAAASIKRHRIPTLKNGARKKASA